MGPPQAAPKSGRWPPTSVSTVRFRRRRGKPAPPDDGTASGALEPLLPADERAQALVLLAAGGAAVEVGAQSGHDRVRVLAGELELDVLVELREALVAADLRRRGPEQPSERLLQIRPFAHLPSLPSHASSASPDSSRCLRSFRRASCNVLYSAPRVVLRRSASTSIRTPFNASATSTCR